jgi:hypothetical protein
VAGDAQQAGGVGVRGRVAHVAGVEDGGRVEDGDVVEAGGGEAGEVLAAGGGGAQADDEEAAAVGRFEGGEASRERRGEVGVDEEDAALVGAYDADDLLDGVGGVAAGEAEGVVGGGGGDRQGEGGGARGGLGAGEYGAGGDEGHGLAGQAQVEVQGAQGGDVDAERAVEGDDGVGSVEADGGAEAAGGGFAGDEEDRAGCGGEELRGDQGGGGLDEAAGGGEGKADEVGVEVVGGAAEQGEGARERDGGGEVDGHVGLEAGHLGEIGGDGDRAAAGGAEAEEGDAGVGVVVLGEEARDRPERLQCAVEGTEQVGGRVRQGNAGAVGEPGDGDAQLARAPGQPCGEVAGRAAGPGGHDEEVGAQRLDGRGYELGRELEDRLGVGDGERGRQGGREASEDALAAVQGRRQRVPGGGGDGGGVHGRVPRAQRRHLGLRGQDAHEGGDAIHRSGVAGSRQEHDGAEKSHGGPPRLYRMETSRQPSGSRPKRGRSAARRSGVQQPGHGAHEDLLVHDGLRDVVVEPQRQKSLAVSAHGVGRKRDDGQAGEARVQAEPTQHLDAVHLGQRHVEQHEVGGLCGHPLQCLGAARILLQGIALAEDRVD